MPKKATELQLYHLSLRRGRRSSFETHCAVEAAGQSTMDEALLLAAGVRDMINSHTGMDYEVARLQCIGTVYVWK